MEKIKQISVFVENAKGKLSNITTVLAENGINIRALSIADTTDFGILRMIVQDPEKAQAVLSENDIMVKATEVMVAEVSDEPAGLNKVLCLLKDNNVTLEYLYAFVTKRENEAYVVMKTDNSEIAEKALTAGGVRVLSAKEVYTL
ncbi:MAG: ACT domain-containing protein [Clostridia bacterium]|nr:ACT domain-containing protein [Clostridia bacterium]